MDIIKNLDVILSVICAFCSIISFLKTRKEHNECLKIKAELQYFLEIKDSSKEIHSEDTFNIKQVDTFDNRKSIR